MTAPSSGPPDIPGLTYVRPLGSGGYADVHLYNQARPRRQVAVKVLKDSGLSERARQRFTAEADAMAGLGDHPNIVQVFAADVAADGRPYLVMMYYSRPNLGERASRERLDVSEVLRIGVHIAGAVDTAHRAGILHRDIKPANILVNSYGQPGLTDFGIAAELAAADDDEDLGVSVPWSPPEVLYASGTPSVSSDVYSLGATLWHLLVGRSPFEVSGGDNSYYALMQRIRDIPVPGTGRADVPASLERLLKQALAKNPAARPASALDTARTLQQIEQELRLPRTEIATVHMESPSATAGEGGMNGGETRMRAAAPMRPVQHSQSASSAWGPAAGTPTVSPGPANTSGRASASPEPALPRHPVSAEPSTQRRSPTVGVGPQEPRQRSLPPRDRPAAPTLHRPVNVSPVHSAPEPVRRVSMPLLVGFALLVLAAIAGVAIWLVGASSAPSPHSVNPTGSSAATDNAVSGLPPGVPVVTGQRIDPSTVRFSWTYAAPQPSDTFRYQTSDGARSGTVTKPTVDLTDPQGQQICVQVKVYRADGSNAAVDWSPAGCTS